jgi:SAM-dependent methyltransferase
MSDDIVRGYDCEAATLVEVYDRLVFEQVHAAMLDLVPATPGRVIDVGAGSGRDALWFATRGWTVVAVEPSAGMRQRARAADPTGAVAWEDDRLPCLARVTSQGMRADLVWLSAVWMHVPPDSRAVAFANLAALVKPGGRLMLTLRHGPAPASRRMYPVSGEEVIRLAADHGFNLLRKVSTADVQKRRDVAWTAMMLERRHLVPDQQTDALPQRP